MKDRAKREQVMGEYIQEMCEDHVQEFERKGILPKGK